MSKCECRYCDLETQGGLFAPGHDQKLRIALEARVGGLLRLRVLIDAMEAYVAGDADTEGLARAVRRCFADVRRRGAE
jgi:hypothetical protein